MIIDGVYDSTLVNTIVIPILQDCKKKETVKILFQIFLILDTLNSK